MITSLPSRALTVRRPDRSPWPRSPRCSRCAPRAAAQAHRTACRTSSAADPSAQRPGMRPVQGHVRVALARARLIPAPKARDTAAHMLPRTPNAAPRRIGQRRRSLRPERARARRCARTAASPCGQATATSPAPTNPNRSAKTARSPRSRATARPFSARRTEWRPRADRGDLRRRQPPPAGRRRFLHVPRRICAGLRRRLGTDALERRVRLSCATSSWAPKAPAERRRTFSSLRGQQTARRERLVGGALGREPGAVEGTDSGGEAQLRRGGRAKRSPRSALAVGTSHPPARRPPVCRANARDRDVRPEAPSLRLPAGRSGDGICHRLVQPRELSAIVVDRNRQRRGRLSSASHSGAPTDSSPMSAAQCSASSRSPRSPRRGGCPGSTG